jgi:hypothetical protein
LRGRDRERGGNETPDARGVTQNSNGVISDVKETQ